MRQPSLLLIAVLSLAMAAVQAVNVPVSIDTTVQPKPFAHFWKKCVGSGHMLLGTRADWREHLKLSVEELGMEGIRGHGLFDDDMSVVPAGKPYEWINVDSVMDYLVELGVTPVVELSFMPSHFVKCGQHQNRTCDYAFNDHGGYKGLTMPPDNFNDWYDLVQSLARHLVERYTLEVVQTWHFEVWNEMWGIPFPDPYMSLYNASALALKSVDKALKVGGPATMQTLYVAEFIDAAKKQELPVDFITTHLYPTDPQCRTNETAHERDCFAVLAQEAQQAASKSGLPFFLTEYNNGLGSTSRDDSTAAAFVFRMIGLLKNFDMFSWWTFSDVFEENWMRSAPFHNGYGMMTMQGVRKPVWRAFQFLSGAGTQRYTVDLDSSSRISVLATNGNGDGNGKTERGETLDLQLFVASWERPSLTELYSCDAEKHQCVVDAKGTFTDPSLCAANCQAASLPLAHSEIRVKSGTSSDDIVLTITHAANTIVPAKARMQRVAPGVADPQRAWASMGSPVYPSKEQIQVLHNASSPAEETLDVVRVDATTSTITLTQFALYTAAMIKF